MSVQRVWAVGDLHGDVGCARYWLGRTGLIRNLEDADPARWEWADADADLVLMGDYLDKGPHARATLELARNLSERFTTHVTALMGNHELNALLDRTAPAGNRYLEYAYGAAHPAQYADWLPADARASPNTTAALVEIQTALLEVYARGLEASVMMSPSGDRSIVRHVRPEARELVAASLATWQDAYLNAIGSGTDLGRWLERRPFTHWAAGTLFVHAGVPPAVGAAGGAQALRELNAEIAEINAEMSAEARSGEAAFSAGVYARPPVRELVEYRGLHKVDCATLRVLVDIMGVSRIAVGHTPGLHVRKRCGGALLSIDSSLGRWFRTSGNHYCPGGAARAVGGRRFECADVGGKCEGQVVVFERGASGGVDTWAVRVIDSDAAGQGAQAPRGLADEL